MTAKMAMTVEEFREWLTRAYNHFILGQKA
jgi:hypothetical protein